jgi:phosphoribosylaminoimidazole (AIR) synthetase
VFNMGFGMVLFVAPEAAERVLAIAAEQGDEARVVGRVVAGQRNVDLV